MENYYKGRDDNLRTRFDGVADEYEEYRLSYPDKLFEDILSYIGTTETALEIGIGTGKATAPFLEAGISVVAIEPNKKMASIAMKKNESKGILKVLDGKFEDFKFDYQFDLVYAASSFQWIRSDNRMNMIKDCLKQGGVFAKFKTVTIVDPTESAGSKALFIAYEENLPEFLPRDKSQESKSIEEFENAGFMNIVRKYYYQKYSFDVKRYLAFMNTYTEYMAIEEMKRRTFEERIIELVGDKDIVIIQKCTLDLAALDEK